MPEIGDDALAAGMDLVIGSAVQAKDIDTEINLTRDYIAQRTNTVTPVAKGGTGATNATTARTNLGIPTIGAGDSMPPNAIAVANAAQQLTTATPTLGDHAANKSYADTKLPLAGGTVSGPFINPYARANGVSSWLSLGVNPSGQFGYQLSARKFKKDIRNWSPEKQAILAMRLVEFRYKTAFADDAEFDQGLIADELHELGLTWLVAYDDDGEPMTVKYDRISLALLAVVQDHDARLSALEERFASTGE